MKPSAPELLARSAGKLAHALAGSGAAAEIARLLIAAGRVTATDRDYAERVTTATQRFFAVFRQVAEAALQEVADADEELFADIRTWFSQPQESYTVEELAEMFRISVDEAHDIYRDQIAGAADAPRVEWTNALVTATVFGLLRPFDIERALGADFVTARTGYGWTTVPVLVRIPLFVAEAIEREPSIPSTLSLPHRIERHLLESFRAQSTIPNGTRPGPP